MDSEFYAVKVVHFVSPYTIFVHVTDYGGESHFEQIGIYGVLPMQLMMDMAENTLVGQRSTEWSRAASMLIVEAFAKAVEVLFCPVLDRLNSIFDDNSHRFGEIVLKQADGELQFLSETLENSSFATYDKKAFESELTSGKIQTKLSHSDVKDIANVLERVDKEQARKQLELFYTAQQFESTLTIQNLKAHNKRTKNVISVEEKLKIKLDDLEKCKYTDLEPIGRATSRLSNPRPASSLLKKRLFLTKPKMNEENLKNVETHSELQVDKNTDDDESDVAMNLKKLRAKIVEAQSKLAASREKRDQEKEKSKEKESRNDTKGDWDVKQELMDEEDQIYTKKTPKKPTKTQKMPEYDRLNEAIVAYGPPDANLTKLVKKVVPKSKFTANNDAVKETEAKGDQPTIETVSKRERSNTLQKRIQLLNRKHFSSASDTSNKDSSSSVDDEVRKSDKVTVKTSKSDKLTVTSPNRDKTTLSKSDVVPSDDESISEIIEQLNKEYVYTNTNTQDEIVKNVIQMDNNVNPFKNLDPNMSVFIEKLVTPVLMVHDKLDKRILPIYELRDVPFSPHIQVVLKNMGVDTLMMVQKISWRTILRGYSTFLISPKNSGKTMGYLPAVCRLVCDNDSGIDGTGPSCIVVCATAKSVSDVERLAKLFLGSKGKVIAFYPSMSELEMTTALLNGCDLFVCTPPILVRLLQIDFGVDLRRVTTFVLDDCERLSEVYSKEIKFFLYKIKQMLKNRIVKEVKVQLIVVSRIWCDFMEPLAKKAPDSVICIGAFQECVLYSKTSTTASFVTEENKVRSVLEFLGQVDTSKRTVIVCRTNEEVRMLEKALVEARYVVFACDNTMTVQDLYNLRNNWVEYCEPIVGPILLCCDGNLWHLNVTDAHYLIHYSLPSLFSDFCKRFSTLNDNYASIFKKDNENVRIKILLDGSNVDQLPKISNFIKRCTTEVPAVLDDICERVLVEKDLAKGRKLVPICDNLLTLGECPDFWNCVARHAVIKEYDEPKDWVPKDGIITFKILYYHTAVLYSVRLLSYVTNGKTVKFADNYRMLAMKIARYFGQESNRRLHGVPKVGDICAMAVDETHFHRCQVIKILNLYEKGNPNFVLVRLLDKEKLERTRDIFLYHLPEEMKTVETYTLHVRLVSVQPKDKDITFSDLAKSHLKKITQANEDLYLKANVSLTIGNCIFVETLETCKDLSLMNKTIVRHDFKQELLEKHANVNTDHLPRLEKLCQDAGLLIKQEEEGSEVILRERNLPKEQWAHLGLDELSPVFFTNAVDPGTFFVRLVKFENHCSDLVDDIQKYVEESKKKPANVLEGDIVLAKLPDDELYERARVDKIIDENKVECFFVDHGDWREVRKENLVEITEKIITQLPFQAIECRLLGVQPPGDHWSEFATNWLTNCLHDKIGDVKQIFVKYFTKDKATHTGGYKYGAVLIDTNSEEDIIVNDLIIQVNLAQENESEINYLNQLDYKKIPVASEENLDDDEDEEVKWEKLSRSSLEPQPQTSPLKDLFLQKPIRSVPLVESDCDSDGTIDKWDSNFDEEFLQMFKPVERKNTAEFIGSNLPAIRDKSRSSSEVNFQTVSKEINSTPPKNDSSGSESNFSQIVSSSNDIVVVSTPKIRELIDSDDLTSPDSTQISIPSNKSDVSSQKSLQETTKSSIIDYDALRKPRVCWRQAKKTVSLKIMIIGAEKYDLEIEERRLKFYAETKDTTYGFDVHLYGLVDRKTSIHANKGQYILVNLYKVLHRNWLALARGGVRHKWIVNDIECIDVSSDEEEKYERIPVEVIKSFCHNDTETEDDDMIDDCNFAYSK